MAAKTVEEFLDGAPADARPALDGLRAMLLSLVPDPSEKISYGIPAVVYRGRPLVGYGATANHCALYLMSTDAMGSLAGDLEGYDLGKGTIRFAPTDPLPRALVARIVEVRIAEAEAEAGPRD